MSPDLKRLKRPDSSNVVRIDSPDDYTSTNAKDRVLFINLGLMKFGTTDKLQGAAIFLTVVFLLIAFLLMLIGLWGDKAWAKDALGWISTPLMLVVGVAVGRGAGSSDSKD